MDQIYGSTPCQRVISPRPSTLCLRILERNMDWARTLCVSSRACLYFRPAPKRLEFSKKNVGIKCYCCAAWFDTAPCGTVFSCRLNGQLLTVPYGLLRRIMCMWLRTHVSRLTPTTVWGYGSVVYWWQIWMVAARGGATLGPNWALARPA